MSTNPQGMKTSYKGNSPAGRVMNEAIELDIEGRSPYPKRATFLDADEPYVGKEIRRAIDEGHAIVLVAADGSTIVLVAADSSTRTLRAEPAHS